MSTPDGDLPVVRHAVTAVVVAHDGVPWLDELIEGLRQQTREPDLVVAVDTGSTDESADVLREALGKRAVATVPSRTGFGAAVDVALRHFPSAAELFASARSKPSSRHSAADPVTDGPVTDGPITDGRATELVEWLWLLHDDCAPDPHALGHLLALAHDEPTAVVVGPKLRDWPQERRLLEVGVAIAGSGSRETGLDYNEFDQGQHDRPREVLAVSTAGMLVRRDVYEALGGLDARLPLFRDDVDFGWRVAQAGYEVLVCPDAVVYHAEAAYRRIRPMHAVRGRPRRVDRTHAIYTLLVNISLWTLPFVLVRLTVGSLLRSVALLLVKWPDAAYDELAGWAAAFARPGAVVRGRLWRRRCRRVPARALRRLHPPPWVGLRRLVDALGSLLATRTGTHMGSSARRRSVVETGPVAEEAEDLADDGWNPLRWLAGRPLVVVVLVLVLAALVAARGLLGSGVLAGGALLPAPDGGGDLWARYVQSWHPAELGSGRVAPPYLPVLAGLATLVLGKAWLLVDLLVLGAVPLAAVTGALFVRRVARSRAVRVWATASYALVPATTGAVSAGRLGTCVAVVLLPLVGLLLLRVVSRASWSATFAAGFVLAVLAAFVPLAWVAAVGLAVAGAVAYARRGAGLVGRFLVVVLVPAVVLAPWIPELVAYPRIVLGEAGLAAPNLAEPNLPAWLVALGSPGGPGSAPAWLYAPIALAALAALLRRDRSTGVVAGWLTLGVGLVLGVAQVRVGLQAPWLGAEQPGWPGFAAALVLAGMIAAAAHGADGIVGRLTQMSFSWRQPLVAVLTIVVAATPAVAGAWWVLRGAADPLDRSDAATLPEYVTDAQTSGARPSSLVLRPDGDGGLRYALVRGTGTRIGDAETGSGTGAATELDEIVADLATGRRAATADRLGRYAVGFVYLSVAPDRTVEGGLVETLDTTPGLSRASAPDGSAAWRVDGPVGRVRLESLNADGDVIDVRPLRSGEAGVDVGLPPLAPQDEEGGVADRRVVLAESFDPGWEATLDGRTVPAAHHGWAVAFDMPAAGGRLLIEHANPRRQVQLVVQAVAVGLVLIFAIPTRTRRDAPPPPVPARRRQGVGAAAALTERVGHP